jgi:hypothetical protein
LRSLGIRRATGSVVVMTEDHCVPGHDWLRLIETWMERGVTLVGGPVENGSYQRWCDWAAFLTEYAGAVRPTQGQISTAPPPGNNVAYRRDCLPGLLTVLDRGQWELFYHASVEPQAIVFDPALVVYHQRPFDVGYFIRQRFHFARSFAAMRRQSFTWRNRLTYGVGSVLLPPWLLWRDAVTLWRKQRLLGRYLLCLPLISLYVTVGAIGEMIGYFSGGGDSLEHVE